VLHQVAWPRIAPGRREPAVGLPPHTGELAGIVITRAPSTVRGHPRRRLLHRLHLNGATIYVLAVIEHASCWIRILGATTHPTGAWTAQQARNLMMDLSGTNVRMRYQILTETRKFHGV